MLQAMSTYVFVKHRLHPGMLDRLVKGGAQAIEIFGARGHFDYTDKHQVRELGNWSRANEVPIHSLHSPIYCDYQWEKRSASVNIVDPDKRLRVEAMDEIKRALETAEVVPFRFIVQHIGGPTEAFTERKFDDALSAVEHLRAFAKPLGVSVLLENIPNEMSAPERLVELLRIGHLDDVGICFDLGHSHLTNTIRRDFETLKPYIRSTHCHDNKGDRDAHLYPGEGTIDWKEAMQLLRTAPHVPPMLLEIEEVDGLDVPTHMAEAFQLFSQVPAEA